MELGSKVATEPLTVFLLLLALVFYTRRKIFLSGIALGLATGIRLIGLALLPVLLWQLMQLRGSKKIKELLIGFFIGLLPWWLFNFFFWGPTKIFLQLFAYPAVAYPSFGLQTLILDILRTIDRGQPKILFSGVFYLALTLLGFWGLVKIHQKTALEKILLLWSMGSLGFIFIFAPKTLLDDFGRYTIPFLPATLYGLWQSFRKLSSF